MITKQPIPLSLGCTPCRISGKQGFQFALYSSQAAAVELCLFDEQGQNEQRIPMIVQDHIWSVQTTKAQVGMQYGFRLYPKSDDSLLNSQKLMLDPYAKAVVGKPDLSAVEKWAIFLPHNEQDNAAFAPKAVIIDDAFDWQDDEPLQTPWAETILYELHVKGFSQLNERLPESIRGTYAALAHPESLAYLRELGVTAVELLPVNYFLDEPHLQQKGLQNYWGYNPLAMFAVEPRYATNPEGGAPLREFKAMVKALHQAGIEVILDVVFNHSAESEKTFPTFSQRGIDDRTYYWQWDNGEYVNYTGCGNTLNLANDVTRRWVVDCLRYWVEECHVDGFRFDLATALGRETPAYNPQALLFEDIRRVPSLQRCKMIAEPWDIGDFGYQVGNFPTDFAEWNDRFRDDMCRFWLWKDGKCGAFAQRFAGSDDIFRDGNNDNKLPHRSVNFITAHDGFTLKDLVSYNQKHNEANGEENRDGRNENYSYNHGIEGIEPMIPEVEQQRFFSRCGLIFSLLLSNGTPMLLAGDEFGNSQFGNNNAYCQNNEITWLKWADFDKHLFKAVKTLIGLRKQIPSLGSDRWWDNDNVQWLTPQGTRMSLEDWHNHAVKAMQIILDDKWLLILNPKEASQHFTLPQGNWKLAYSAAEISLQDAQLNTENLNFCILHQGALFY
ncbi:glycogen debranching protein GlgX [Actinobacillus porcinus]|uniref:glycogen debranching protein GlgX n=1 Tax=Actinobacillus porcinus TaxID=51048 RepID=UPI0023557D62|nr:glycogen debranching protein GlgX [Actinobacillus porcinus]